MIEQGNRIRVIMVEAFNGKRYLIKLMSKDWKEHFTKLFDRLFGNNQLGSVACVSIRYISQNEYDKATHINMKGLEDGKDNKEKSEGNESADETGISSSEQSKASPS